MIKADFFTRDGSLSRFRVSGHAGYAPAGEDIVCASVSSAVQLTANGITEVLGVGARVSARGERVSLQLDAPSAPAAAFLEALRLHLSLLAEEYPDYIQITCSEVTVC